MTKFRYVKRKGIWYQRDPEGLFADKPMPAGFVPPKKDHVLARTLQATAVPPKKGRAWKKLSLISILAALGTLGAFKGERSSKNNKSDPSITPILKTVDGRAILPAGFVSPDFDRTQDISEERFFPVEFIDFDSSVLDNAETVLANNVSNSLFRSLQAVMPTNTPTNTLWLYTSALQTLSTDTSNVCHAVGMPQTNFVHFVRMAEQIPTNQLGRVIEGTNTWFNFTPITNALANATNTFAFAQAAFEQGQRYQLLTSMTNSLPTYEGNTDFIYWDNAKDKQGHPIGHPTIGVGLNLEAHPDLLRQLHFKNSTFVQKIIHSNPKDRSNEEYIQLSVSELRALTRHARAHHHGEVASNYETTYGLAIDPADQDILDNYFIKKTASTISRTERSLQAHAPTNFTDNSVIFGSYTNAVPLSAGAVATDIVFNTGNDLNTRWPLFSDAYVTRDFEAARLQCHVRNEPSDRSNWKDTQMRAATRERTNRLAALRSNNQRAQ